MVFFSITPRAATLTIQPLYNGDQASLTLEGRGGGAPITPFQFGTSQVRYPMPVDGFTQGDHLVTAGSVTFPLSALPDVVGGD